MKRTDEQLRELQRTLTRTELARAVTQREWDRLFPPRTSEHEPSDASGFTDEVGIIVID